MSSAERAASGQESTCPLCGGANECGAARGDCWCFTATFFPGMVERAQRVSPDACLCPACAAGEIASPCIKDCRIDLTTGTCRGCRRTLDEIAGWTTFSVDEKLRVLRRVRAR